jgi:hypothetical protein
VNAKAFLLHFTEAAQNLSDAPRDSKDAEALPIVVNAGTRTLTEVRREADDRDPMTYSFAIIPTA